MRVTHVFSSPVADATGTLTVWAGSTTATAIATDMVRPTNWNSAHGLVQDIGGNTLGVSSVSGSNLVLAGGANITLSGVQGANVGSVTIIGGTGEVGTGTTFGGTNISGSMTLNSAGLALSLSGGAGGGGGSINVSAGTTSNNLTNFVMSNSNNVSFGLNGSTITATANARASNDGIGLNTAQTNVTWTVNSSGLSLNAAGYAGTGTTFGGTNISGSITQNSNGIALSLSGLAALTSQSNQAASAANGSFAFQTISFSNLNGISFGTSAGSAITASHNALTSQSNQALSAANGSFTFQTAQFSNANGVSFVTSAGSAIAASVNTAYVGLNTAQTNVTWTVNSSGISLNASGYAGTGTTFNGANISGSITQNSVGLNLSLSVAAPGAANINVSAGTTSNDVTQIVFSNSNGVTFGLDGSTITASAAGGGGAVNTIYFTQLLPAAGYLSISNFAHAQNQLAIYPFDVSAAVSISALAIPVTITNSSTASSSGQVGYTVQIGIYSQGTNTTRVDSMYTTDYTIAASNSSDVSRAVTWIDGIVNGTSYSTNSSSSAGLNLSSLFHGNRELQLAYDTVLTPGRYWMAARVSTSVAGSSQGVLSVNFAVWRLGLSMDMFRIGSAANNASISAGQQFLGLGIYSVTTGNLPSTIGYSELRRDNQQLYPVVQIRRSNY